jgi:ABC-type transporter Mla subunit MlaD
MSKPFRERNPVVIGAISISVILLMLLSAFKAQDLPLIGGGDKYTAAFSEAGGLKVNDEVRIAGVRVGKVESIKLEDDHVKVTFRVKTDSEFGTETGAAIKVKTILGSLDQISQLSVQTASLVKGIRSPLVDDIANLRKLTANIQRNRGELDRALQVLPIKLEKVGRTAIYGSWFNFYLCQFEGKIKLPGLTVPVQYNTGSARCDLG